MEALQLAASNLSLIGMAPVNMTNDERMLVFLRAPHRQGGATLRYQWQRNRIDLPRATQACVLLESTADLHAASIYSVLIDDGDQRDVQPPAVLAFMRTRSSPPWRLPELAAELRGQPDLFATLATVFRELCVKQAI